MKYLHRLTTLHIDQLDAQFYFTIKKFETSLKPKNADCMLKRMN